MLQNENAELAMLGMGLADPDCANRMASLPDDLFSFPDTRAVFLGIKKVITEHGRPDIVTVSTAIEQMGLNVAVENTLLKAGAMAYTTVNYRQYETILLDLWKRRQLSKACMDMFNRAQDPGENLTAMTADMVKVLQDSGKAEDGVVSAQDALMELLDRLNEKVRDASYTGIAGLDRKLGGFKPEQLIVLGARPGVGKTALGLQMAANIAKKSGPVLVVSLEMSKEEIMTRLLAAEAGVDSSKIDNHKLDDDEWDRLSGSYQVIGGMPLWISESATTPLQIRREAQAIQRKHGLKMILVDYLQLLRSDTPTRSRYEDITAISREMKLLAKELKVTVMALTQFNRESEGKAGMKKRRPTMAEAKDSGAIEQDANVFMIQYAPDEPDANSDLHPHWEYCQAAGYEWQTLTVEKNRQGRTGYISLAFDKPHMSFITIEDLEQ